MQVRFITGGKVQCDLAKCLTENPQFKGLCFRTGHFHLAISRLAPEVCFLLSSQLRENFNSLGLECQILPAAAREERWFGCQLPDCFGPCPEKRWGQWSGWQLSISKGQLSNLTLKSSVLGFASALYSLWNPSFSFLKILPQPRSQYLQHEVLQGLISQNPILLFVTFLFSKEWLLSFI